MELADTIRVAVAVQYRTRSWQTIEVDLGPAATPAVDLIEPQVQGLLELGLPITSPVPCLALSDQVAQKLHACTSPHSRSRARDVLDILMIDTLGHLDYALTAATTRQVFLERAAHPFPSRFKMPDVWRRELEALALEMGFRDPSANHLEQCFLDIIERLETHR